MAYSEHITEEIKILDAKIVDAKKIIAKIESGKKIDEKVYGVLKAKLHDWTTKRDVFLNLLLKQVKK